MLVITLSGIRKTCILRQKTLNFSLKLYTFLFLKYKILNSTSFLDNSTLCHIHEIYITNYFDCFMFNLNFRLSVFIQDSKHYLQAL